LIHTALIKNQNISRLSYIPVVSPTMKDARIELLCQAADTYLYVLSRMGVTGSAGEGASSSNVFLAQFLQRLHHFCGNKPFALGLGVSTREQFLSMQEFAPGVVAGTQIIKTINGTPWNGELAEAIESYCMYLTGRSKTVPSVQLSLHCPTVDLSPDIPCLPQKTILPSYFGPYGGQYVPELLLDSLEDLERCFIDAQADSDFWKQYQGHSTDMFGRFEGPLQVEVEYGTSEPRATLWLKQKDSHAAGKYRTYSTLGQILLACRLGKKRILTETTAEGDAVVTATLCARLGLHCVLFMGARDLKRFPGLSVRVDKLGGTLLSADGGGQAVRDAINTALQAWIADLHDSHYIPSFAIGPHPFPTIVRTFQALFGNEVREEAISLIGKPPDAVIVSAVAGDAAVALLPGFLDIAGLDIVLVDPSEKIMTMSPGVFHGSWTEVQQDKHGQVSGEGDPQFYGYHSYPALEPELSHWVNIGKARVRSCDKGSDSSPCSPPLVGNRVVHIAREVASQLQRDQNVLVIVS
jgi:tryptophan synthase